ncbi:MAG: hypothetical protein GY793_11615 [Proteobacteria bacterium]|nr:hypothetical protein [Pseudomonadota bacterium]
MYHERSDSKKRPLFFQTLTKLYGLIFTDTNKIPFGKSVAFLAGVSQYRHLKSLEYVKNDLMDMQLFLLTKGGFDEVYVASEGIVSRDLIDNYIRNVFPMMLNKEDRLFFYYSGHGADSRGRTGYMQFSKAEPGNFAGSQVMAINNTYDWCSEIETKHLLFIFDCCASGLAFSSKGDTVKEDYHRIISTLSRNGSRAIITAGTADEDTFEVKDSKGRGNGVFTRAFLNAVETGMADKGRDGFMTTYELIAHIKDEVARFAAKHDKKVTPQLWSFDLANYPGTFIFINPEVKRHSINFPIVYSDKLAAIRTSELITKKGKQIAAHGTIQLISNLTGEVYIDGIPVGKIEKGDVKEYIRLIGEHEIEVKSKDKTVIKKLTLEKGEIVKVTTLSETDVPWLQCSNFYRY